MNAPALPDPSSYAVLVVEDELFSREVVARALNTLNFGSVAKAGDGVQAIKQMQSAVQPFDAVITDYRMPEMNGLELLRRIRSGITGAPRDTIVGILTGGAEEEVVRGAFHLDADFFIAKPPTVARLRIRLEAALALPRQVRPAASYEDCHEDSDNEKPANYEAGPSGIGRPPMIERLLADVPAGSVLGADLRIAGGNPIIRRGTVLDAKLLERLSSLAEIDPRFGTVSISSAG